MNNNSTYDNNIDNNSMHHISMNDNSMNHNRPTENNNGGFDYKKGNMGK